MKKFLVIGLGRFGSSVALALEKQNCEVMVLDHKEERLRDIQDLVTYALVGDATDRNVLEKIGVKNFEAVIVCIGLPLEVSIMTTALLKELGASKIIVKGQSELHAKVLQMVGADKVVQPELDMGARLAQNLIAENFMDFIALSSTHSIIEMVVPDAWVGKSILELDVRKKFNINILAIKKKTGAVDAAPKSDSKFEVNDVIVVLGDTNSLEKL